MRKQNSEFLTAFISEASRKIKNTDYFGFVELDKFACYVIADGIDDDVDAISAKLAVDTVVSAFMESPSMSKRAVRRYLRAANRALLTARSKMRLKASVTVLVTNYVKLRYGQAGNTRFRLYRDGFLRMQSRDSSELLKIEQYVEMVLGYLRLGSETTDYVFRKYDLDALLRQSLRKYARLFILKKISLDFQETGRTVLTDEKWLTFVLEQLLSNAVKYTPEGGRVRIYGDGETLVIADSGIGIQPEDLPRVFEKGFTGFNGREDKKSTGIGLYLWPFESRHFHFLPPWPGNLGKAGFKPHQKRGGVMAVVTKVISPEEDGATVRHILRAKLHFSSHAVSRLAHGGACIFVNGVSVHTPHVLRAGDVLAVETEDRRPPKAAVTPGNWPLPVVWEDEHLLLVDKPAGMTAHASNFLPDTPTVAGALAWSRGADFIFHPVNRLDKGTAV